MPDRETELSEHPDGTRPPAFEIAGGKALAGGELIRRGTSSRVTWSQGGECAIGPPRSLSAYIYAAPAVAAGTTASRARVAKTTSEATLRCMESPSHAVKPGPPPSEPARTVPETDPPGQRRLVRGTPREAEHGRYARDPVLARSYCPSALGRGPTGRCSQRATHTLRNDRANG